MPRYEEKQSGLLRAISLEGMLALHRYGPLALQFPLPTPSRPRSFWPENADRRHMKVLYEEAIGETEGCVINGGRAS